MENQTVKLELNVQQLNVILAALGKMPLESVLEVFNTIQQQASQQLGAPKGPLSDKVVSSQ